MFSQFFRTTYFDEYFSHFKSVKQNSIVKNFNRIASHFPQLKLTKLNEDGTCGGLTYSYALYAKSKERAEFIRCLQFISLLDDPDKMDLFLKAADKILNLKKEDALGKSHDIEIKLGDNIPAISFKTVCKFLEDVSRCQADQSILQINANWDSTYSFISKKEYLSEFLLRRNIQIGERAVVGLGGHVYYIERASNGFYLFEPNNIDLGALYPILKDENELAEKIYKNCKSFITENKLMVFSMSFITYGNQRRKLDDILQELRQDQINTPYPTIDLLIQQYYLRKFSRFELALRLLEEINQLKTDIVDPLLENAEKKLLAYVEPKLLFQAETISQCQPYLNEKTFKQDISLLYLAVQSNEISLVKQLLKRGVDPNLATSRGVTPLYIAAQNGYLEIVELLLKYNANPNLVMNDGGAPLYIAAKNGHLEIVELLLKYNVNPNLTKKNGSTALYSAAQNGHLAVVELLFENGAKCNLPMQASIDVLLITAKKHGRLSMVEALFKKAGLLTDKSTSFEGFTALHAAAFLGHKNMVELLLKHGADLSEKAAGLTAVAFAEAMGHREIVDLLESRLLDHSVKKVRM